VTLLPLSLLRSTDPDGCSPEAPLRPRSRHLQRRHRLQVLLPPFFFSLWSNGLLCGVRARLVDASTMVMESCISCLIDLHSSDDQRIYQVTLPPSSHNSSRTPHTPDTPQVFRSLGTLEALRETAVIFRNKVPSPRLSLASLCDCVCLSVERRISNSGESGSAEVQRDAFESQPLRQIQSHASLDSPSPLLPVLS
jgi:hypothetical protein